MRSEFIISAAVAVSTFTVSITAAHVDGTCAFCDLDFSDIVDDTWKYVDDAKEFYHNADEDVHSMITDDAKNSKEHFSDAVEDIAEYIHETGKHIPDAVEDLHSIAAEYGDHWEENMTKGLEDTAALLPPRPRQLSTKNIIPSSQQL